MKHPDEHRLELYVLDAESVAADRAEVEEHLRSCAGCRALVDEISHFYTDLDRELRRSESETGAPSEHRLTKRARDLAFWEERLATGPHAGLGSPVKKLRYYIRRYPIAAAGATVAFTALAGLALVTGYREVSRDTNPSYVRINQQSGFFEAYNRRNELLWSRIMPSVGVTISEQDRTEVHRYVVADIDADGRPEVLTPLALGGEPALRNVGLHIFDGKGGHSDILYERKIVFRGDPYEMPIRIENGSLVLVDTASGGAPEIFITVKNDRSPNAIVRMTGTGDVLGEYWHQGQIAAFYLRDLDGDGRRELVACGFNDADDKAGISYPAIIVLDPRRISDRRESRLTRGYGLEASDAELHYIRLPLTEINDRDRVNAGVVRMRVHDDRLVFLWTYQPAGDQHFDLDFVFSRSLEPLRVVPPTQIRQLFEREFAAGRLGRILDDAYLRELTSRVRFWDGRGWNPEPVKLGSGTAAAKPD